MAGQTCAHSHADRVGWLAVYRTASRCSNSRSTNEDTVFAAMSQKLVRARVFSSRMEAEIARSLLDAYGIPSFVRADDAGGMRPAPFQFAFGVELIVREQDFIAAQQLLKD